MMTKKNRPLILDRVLAGSSHVLLYGTGRVDRAILKLRRRFRRVPLDLRAEKSLSQIRSEVCNYLKDHDVLWVLLAPEVSNAVRSVLSEVLEGRLVEAGRMGVRDGLRLIAVCPEQPDRAVFSMFPLAMATTAAMKPAEVRS